jgi:signal transduction histidine kinase/CheY-like chemotaxis protein
MNGGAGVDARWANCWAPDDLAAAQQAFSAALSGGRAQFEISAGQEGGIVRWDVSVTPLFGQHGSVPRVLCVTRDVTAERRAEEELRQTAKLESLGVMAGGIAHDFNNLLTGILGNASLLCDSLTGADRELAEDISLAGERAADLTQQMLAFAGKGRFQVHRVDVSLLVQEMLRLVRPSIKKNIDLELNLQPACVVEGDTGQIQQVIMNLLINAGEALNDNPGVIQVRTCNVSTDRVYMSQTLGAPDTPEGEYVCLEITDNGSGMDAATKARIFDPFFTTKFAGRGLGLAAVLGIVRGHKGLLHVYSEPGEGTTFRVLLPASEQSHLPALPATAFGNGYGVVLLADDEEIVQRVASEVLTRHGYQVRLARNGEEAVRLYRENLGSIRLIILDLTMPVMNGEQALRCLSEEGNAVPVILSSGYTEAAITGRFETEKVAGFLQKPYTAAKLLEKVHSVLEGQ